MDNNAREHKNIYTRNISCCTVTSHDSAH